MRKIEIESKRSPHFMGCWNIENNSLCQSIIDFFEANPRLQTQGVTGAGVDTKRKNSIDIPIHPNYLSEAGFEPFNDYFETLNTCFESYKEEWPFLKTFIDTIHIGSFNVQKYNPGGHFGQPHSERTGLAMAHRLFAWMTYLNDVDDGGTTDFEYYDLKIKPEMGKTLIWPAEWTHLHTGSVLNSGVKYIVTGWIHFSA